MGFEGEGKDPAAANGRPVVSGPQSGGATGSVSAAGALRSPRSGLAAKAYATGAAATLLLGIVHLAATPFVFRMGFDELERGNALAFLFMYDATGLATAAAGLLLWKCRSDLDRFAIRAIARGAAAFVAALALGAVATMWDNPFAWMMLVVAALLPAGLRKG